MNNCLFVLIFIIIFPLTSFSSDWILILKDDIREVYVDTETINIDKDKREVFIKTVRNTPVNFHPRSYSYWTKYFINQYHFDCINGRFKIQSSKYYDENDKQLPKIRADKEWIQIHKGRKTEEYYNFVCSYEMK